MEQRGELRTTPGRIVPVDFLLRDALQLFGQPRLICCDRWRAGELLDGLDKVGLGRVPVDFRGMGYKEFTRLPKCPYERQRETVPLPVAGIRN